MKDMKLFRTIVILAALLLSSVSGMARQSEYVSVPSQYEMVNVDSVFTVVAPDAKSVLKYRDFYSERSITLYSDSFGRLLMAIDEASYGDGQRINTDTLLLSSEGYLVRRACQTVYKGKLEKYKVYEADAKETVWKYYCSEIQVQSSLVGVAPDANGNWTALHIGIGGGKMRGQPTITRQTSYSLSLAESEMLSHYDNLRTGITTKHFDFVGIGIAMLVVAAVIAIYTLRSRTLNDKLRPRLAGFASGPIALVGFYIIFENFNSLFGSVAVCIVGIMFILLMSWYFNRIIVLLEDNEALSNNQVYTPFIFTKIGLLFIGWMIGATIFHVWWAALLTLIVFGIPIFSVPNRGERCEKCHKVGAVQHAETENCGFRIDSKREGNYMVIRKWNRVREVRRCKYCGYEYRMPEKDGRLEWERFEEMSPAPQNRVKEKPLSRADKALQSIDYKDPYLYRKAAGGLNRACNYDNGCGICSKGEKHPCEYPNQQCYCPYFSPSRSYMENARQIVRNDNTPI